MSLPLLDGNVNNPILIKTAIKDDRNFWMLERKLKEKKKIGKKILIWNSFVSNKTLNEIESTIFQNPNGSSRHVPMYIKSAHAIF